MSDAPPFDTARFQETLVSDGAFTDGQARVLTRAMSDATAHVPSRDRLDQLEFKLQTLISDRLSDQTWKVTQLVVTAVLFNALVVAGAAIAVYNAVRP